MEKIDLGSEEFQRLIAVCEALSQDYSPEDWAKFLVENCDNYRLRAIFEMAL